MSILFVLLMFLLIMSISYFRGPKLKPAVKPGMAVVPQAARVERELGFDVPQGYCFHPGHTWARKETSDIARVGIDAFAANLIGQVDRIEIVGPNRWVRQGQKLVTLHAAATSLDLLSPVEGVITEINRDALDDPGSVTRDCYNVGWIAVVKAPDLAVNQKNLVQGTMVAPWMQNNIARLTGMLAQLSPNMAQDGGVPLKGLLGQVSAELRQKLAKEFFLA